MPTRSKLSTCVELTCFGGFYVHASCTHADHRHHHTTTTSTTSIATPTTTTTTAAAATTSTTTTTTIWLYGAECGALGAPTRRRRLKSANADCCKGVHSGDARCAKNRGRPQKEEDAAQPSAQALCGGGSGESRACRRSIVASSCAGRPALGRSSPRPAARRWCTTAGPDKPPCDDWRRCQGG